MNTQTVKYPTGQITLYLDEFFPAPLSKVKKIIKLIRRDYEWTPDKTCDLIQYLAQRIIDDANQVIVYCEKEKDYLEQAQTWKYQSRCKTSEEYKQFMYYRDKAHEYRVTSNQLTNEIKSLKASQALFMEVQNS